MATSSIGFTLRPRSFESAGSLSASLRVFVFTALLALSFVPIPIGINLSQILVLALCVATLCCYLVHFEVDIFAAIFLILLIGISQAIGLAHSPVVEKNYLTPFIFLTSLSIAPAIVILAKSCTPSKIRLLVPRIVNWILVFLVIECISRFIFSPYLPLGLDADNSDTFYLYKSSLFFVDSNFVGIEIICLLAVMFAFRDCFTRNKWFLAYLLLITTLSRASIGAAICQIVVYKLWRWRAWVALGMLAAQVLIVIKLFVTFTSQGSEGIQGIDGSLSSKFFILSLMADTYVGADTAQKLFGIGVSNLFNLAGIFAHNIVATCVLELGIVGTLLIAVYVWVLSRRHPAAVFLLILPVLINGFSLVSTSMPYFFAALGLLTALHGTRRNGDSAASDETGLQEIKKG